MSTMDRRFFLSTAAGAALSSAPKASAADAADLKAIQTAIDKQHDGNVSRLRDWIKQPSIAAENRGMTEGCDMMMSLQRDAGFTKVEKVPTKGQPGVFATLDA